MKSFDKWWQTKNAEIKASDDDDDVRIRGKSSPGMNEKEEIDLEQDSATAGTWIRTVDITAE